jgi:hypothetical protein
MDFPWLGRGFFRRSESRILRGILRGKGEPLEVRLFDGVGSLSGGFACGDLVAGRGMDLERTDNRFALE